MEDVPSPQKVPKKKRGRPRKDGQPIQTGNGSGCVKELSTRKKLSGVKKLELKKRNFIGQKLNTSKVYLPPGWKCFATKRSSGLLKGAFDLIYLAPNGDRLRSRNDILRWSKLMHTDVDPTKFLFSREINVLLDEENAKSIIFRNAVAKKKRVFGEACHLLTTYIADRGKELIGEKDELLMPKKRVYRKRLQKTNVEGKSVEHIGSNEDIKSTLAQKNGESSKPQKCVDTLDCLKSPYFAFKSQIPLKPVSIHAVHNGKWIPPRSPYNLIQEDLYRNPWQLLIATIFLNCTTGKLAIPVIHEFLARWSSPHEACSASLFDILEVVDLLGLGRTRAATIIRFSHEFLTVNWKTPNELFGIGKYGNDSYKVFCLGQWRGVESDDKYLNLYINWMCNAHRGAHPTRGGNS